MIDEYEIIKRRAIKILNIIKDNFGVSGNYFIAGNSLNRKKFSDIDIFPKGDNIISVACDNIIVKTKNATTYKNNDIILQVCDYRHLSLESLVNSFDFAHVQIGAEVKNIVLTDVYFTENFKKYKIIEDSTFIDTEYPLSSLIRLGKYYKKNEITKGSYIYSCLTILSAIIKRGFIDYVDFKGQLDAVDLGLLPEQLSDVKHVNIKELFELLRKDV